ncbi:MAG: Nif11-like leader peptide family RiPP precursor [Ruminiclostridium sp.]|nr:Nif11-like leader peptide family RiPP precursor [Ruminiclostridium sp.]MBP3856229.1 Nif11-like leader peptide family RiPP precursor [Ruminiclostridium sp.]
MKENLKKFLEEASKNEELKAKLAAITDKDTAVAKAIELAKEYGYTLTAEDFEQDKDDKLSLDEVYAVSGGGDGTVDFCFFVSWTDAGCGCFIIGAAEDCGCFLGGGAA